MSTIVFGYIVLKAEPAEGQPLVALSRRGRVNSARWVEHRSLPECFVYSARAIRRALRLERKWTGEAVLAVPATYNVQGDPRTTLAEPDEKAQIPFAELRSRLTAAPST